MKFSFLKCFFTIYFSTIFVLISVVFLFPVFTSNEVIIFFAHNPFNICDKFPFFWETLKKLYICITCSTNKWIYINRIRLHNVYKNVWTYKFKCINNNIFTFKNIWETTIKIKKFNTFRYLSDPRRTNTLLLLYICTCFIFNLWILSFFQ